MPLDLQISFIPDINGDFLEWELFYPMQKEEESMQGFGSYDSGKVWV